MNMNMGENWVLEIGIVGMLIKYNSNRDGKSSGIKKAMFR